ncbi:molecular chaperone DnaJ [Candidatus Thiodictyon syntrophicum]|uniref:Molecular chaperone DnaJ n=1 Tax=Candidatus Thiodictyon syntrophicum TaxID=1166950 RepID=A0A2K8UGH7_9GAMM|nr:molecular chaperone DnaJ [Candidatus Thiodictyon syntrophicum]
MRLLLVPLFVLGVLWLVRWFRRTPPARVADTLRKVAMWTVIGVLVLAAATGRLSPVFAFIAALIPAAIRVLTLLQAVPVLQRLLRSLGIPLPGGLFGGGPAAGAAGGGGGGGAPGGSSIRTRFLEMRLDHATGAMDGRVLEGPFAQRALRDLRLDELLRMLELYREADAQSAAVLEAYLDRERGTDWRARDPGPGAARVGSGGGPMNEAEALAILGLEPGADALAVRDAHRRLMQRLHPDRGGSGYLAAKINEAKQVLLKGLG